MGKDIQAYVRSYSVCQVMKSDNRKKAGLLQPIPIPSRKWEQITTDLVTDLPLEMATEFLNAVRVRPWFF